ncbi:MAG: Mov34/MPN/PAD-1 family protein [Rhizomicrobium sp.]
MTTLLLSRAHRAQIESEARAAFPRECCGLLEGKCDGDTIRVTALHSTRNLSAHSDRFEIDPADQFRLLHAARARGRDIVGCYHSHPNGRTTPSARDGDSEDGFLWLIAAVADGQVGLSAFRRNGGSWQSLEMGKSGGKSA